MIRTAVIFTLLAAFVFAAASVNAANPEPTPTQQIAKLKQQLRARTATIDDKNETIASLRDQRDAQDAVLADQSDTIARLRARLANQPDPLDAILARDPDGLWAAMVAIWKASPAIPEGALCGYDKSQVPGGDVGLTLTSYTFYKWSGC